MATILTGYNSWEQGMFAEIERRREHIIQIVMAHVPTELDGFLSAEPHLISEVMRFRSVRKKYLNDPDGPYGYSSRTDLIRKMRALRKAWKDLIDIKVNRGEPHRLTIEFILVDK